MNFFCPQGIGDSLWALHKIRAVAADHAAERIDLYLASSGVSDIQSRALPFLERFSFLNSVGLENRTCLRDVNYPATSDGYWNYHSDGPMDIGDYAQWPDRYALMPNASLERGIRLEEWLPHYRCDWDTMSGFRFLDAETRYAEQLLRNIGPYCVFYLGPESGNTVEGHNRGGLWTPQQWRELGQQLRLLGLQVVVVGANYDRSYWSKCVRREGLNWHEFIGRWHIGQTLAVVKRAALCVSYQSGIGICAHYMATPTAMWWRAKGDSACASRYISFEESMSHCWRNPNYRERYLPLIYGRCSVDEIIDFAERSI